MKATICDLCSQPFQYGEETSKTDGGFVTVRVGITNVRVCLSVKAHLADKGDHADICPSCRQQAIERVLHGTVPGHQGRGDHLR